MAKWMVLSVTLEDRDDGGVYVSSDDLPGLILSGADKERIAAEIMPSIRALLEHRGLRNIRIYPSTPPSELLMEDGPRNLDVRIAHMPVGVQTRQFIVEIEPLAA